MTCRCPLTSRWQAPEMKLHPVVSNSLSSRSRLVVPRSGPRFKICLLALLATGIAGLTAGPQPAHASGCHAPDRPVMARSLLWQRWQRAGGSLTQPAVLAPPLLLPMPCPGEIPVLPSFATGILEPFCTPESRLDPPSPGERLGVRLLTEPGPLIHAPLDRPPRQDRDRLPKAV